MKQVIILFFSSIIFMGCSSMGATSIESKGIHIKVGEKVLNSKDKVEELTDREMIETMHRYLAHRLKKLRVRNTLRFDITVTGLRLRTSMFSPGRDRISIDVVVKENDAELKKFSESISTGRGRNKAINRMSKGLAKSIYEQIKDL